MTRPFTPFFMPEPMTAFLTPRLLASALALATCTLPALAQTHTLRIGASHFDPNSVASQTTGPFLLSPVSGQSLALQSQDTGLLSYAYTLHPNVEVEFNLKRPSTHRVVAEFNPGIAFPHVVAGYQGQVTALLRLQSPLLFINYRFGEPGDALRAFVGVGVNRTRFDKRVSTAQGNGLAGGPTDLRLHDSWSPALQAGLTWTFSPGWSLQAAVGTQDVRTRLTATTAGAVRTTDIRLRPMMASLSLGYSF